VAVRQNAEASDADAAIVEQSVGGCAVQGALQALERGAPLRHVSWLIAPEFVHLVLKLCT
jgi:hypothetical protein